MEMKDKKILYVEDDLSLIEGLKYTLEKNGFLVDNARTVKESYRFFQAGRYDLLLLDVIRCGCLAHMRRYWHEALPGKSKKSSDKTPAEIGFDYCNQLFEPYMENYLLDGRCSISNNIAENIARPYAVGRKNLLFHDTVKGARASSIISKMSPKV